MSKESMYAFLERIHEEVWLLAIPLVYLSTTSQDEKGTFNRKLVSFFSKYERLCSILNLLSIIKILIPSNIQAKFLKSNCRWIMRQLFYRSSEGSNPFRLGKYRMDGRGKINLNSSSLAHVHWV